MITFILLWVATLFELCAHLVASRLPRLRTILAITALFLGISASLVLIAYVPNVFSALFGLLSLYRGLSLARILKHQMHEVYLRKATRRSTIGLLAMQAVVLLAWWAWENWHTTGHATWAALSIIQAVTAGVLFYSIMRTLRRTVWPQPKKHYSDKDLPSITVAIPARNETEDLQQCLQSIIGSDYPKLEIIVLDDCSQNRRTPEIIRQFAHDGVRFIQGQTPSEAWMPKNQAYDQLAQEASGEYILFCGVDIRFSPQSVRAIISTMLDRQKDMLCVMPRRHQDAYGRFSLIQAMRYWWELALPRRQLHRPPVLSSCWAIRKQVLNNAGGFAAFKRAITPEAFLARAAMANDGYSFLRCTDGLGIESTKSIAEQRQTAIRTRYPQVHRRPGQVALTTIWELTFLLMPFVLAVGGAWLPIGPVAWIAAIVASIFLTATYEATVLSSRVNTWWFGLISQPLTVLVDIVLLHYSMWRYEFSTVDWKGRNVCVPVMHIEPHLPPIADSVRRS